MKEEIVKPDYIHKIKNENFILKDEVILRP